MGPQLPLVSVLIRSVDRASLDIALHSVEVQTWRPLEIVVVKAKEGGHRPLPSRIGDVPLRFIDAGAALSRSAAANALLEHARGQYCVFLDDDDFLLPEHASTLARALGATAGAIAAYGNIYVRDAKGAPMGEFALAFDAIRLQVGNFLPIHSVLFRRSAIDSGVRFDPGLDYCEDWDFWIHLERLGSFIHVDTFVGVYVTHEGQGFGLHHDAARLREVDGPVLRKTFTACDTARLYEIAQTVKRGLDADAALRTMRNAGFAARDVKHGLDDMLREVDDGRRASALLHEAYRDLRGKASLAELAEAIVSALRPLHEASQGGATLARQAQAGAEAIRAVEDLKHALRLSEAAKQTALARIEEIHASRSWRFSAPLRSAGDVARRIKRRVGRSGRVGSWLVRRWDHWRASHLRQLPTMRRLDSTFAAPGLTDLSGVPRVPMAAPRRIGVHVHAFYPDIVPEIAAALAHIAHPIDLFVSVCDAAAASAARRALQGLTRVRALRVEVVENRGRDIAPMVLQFAEALRGCDYVLHLHTKKSLYTGAERDDWRGYLLRQLLGGAEHVEKIFSIFETEPDLGLVYPQNFGALPYVANTWLANRAVGHAWCARLGITPPRDAYFDFPAGSMFWARADALKTILDHPWSPSDFPDEAGQTDGTTAHVLERLLVIAAHAHGYRHRVLLDTLQPNWSSWRTDTYFSRNVEETIRQIQTPGVKLAVFDIFDTLLTRPLLDAEATKLIIAARAPQPHGAAYLAHRARVEGDARRRLQRDVDLDAVYEEFVAQGIFDAQTAEVIKQLEIDVEFASLRPRADVIEVLRRACAHGRAVVLASDMFLPLSVIERALASHDVQGWAKLYLSNVEQARKDEGSLYDKILSEKGLRAQDIIMLGDNERSDVQIPMDRRMRFAHVMRAVDQARTLPRWRALLDRVEREDVHTQVLGGMLVNRFFGRGLWEGEQPTPSDFLFDGAEGIGYAVVGPMLTVFSLWLYERARKSGKRRLLFLAREGEMLKLAFDRLSQSLGWDIETAYVELSRRCVTVASMRTVDDCRRIAAAAPYRLGDLRDFLSARFGLTLSDTELAELRRSGVWGGEAIEVRSSAAHLDPLVEHLGPRLLAHGATEAQGLRAYLEGLCLDARADALVDVGYSGTIQDYLSGFSGKALDGYYMLTTAKIRGVVQRHRSEAHGCFGEDLVLGEGNSAYWRHSFAIEQLLSSDQAQVACYTPGAEGAAVATRVPLSDAELEARKPRAEARRGTFNFLDDFIRIRAELLPGFVVPTALAESVFEAWISEPSPRERKALELLVLDDHYCGRGLVKAE